jgi:ectoine hydroxylase-related dioxygenase (phytanoyl-CoA dioxygenase family)
MSLGIEVPCAACALRSLVSTNALYESGRRSDIKEQGRCCPKAEVRPARRSQGITVSVQTLGMLTRSTGYLTIRHEAVSPSSEMLQDEGYVVLRGVFSPEEVGDLCADVERVFDEYPPDERSSGYDAAHWTPFRYEMFNRSALVQRAVAHPQILEVVEPLVGEDCHIIANTAWWQLAGNNKHLGHFWHIDSGPHVPRDPGVPWDDRIPYPVFAIATHIYLWDCPLEAGPTGVIPRSHTSGQSPPRNRMTDDDLEWQGHGVVPIVAQAGDVALFVSDIWHRRQPPLPGDPGRMFLQCHYGRRDLAQRLRPTSAVNHASDEAVARAQTPREKRLIGLHSPGFYDG